MVVRRFRLVPAGALVAALALVAAPQPIRGAGPQQPPPGQKPPQGQQAQQPPTFRGGVKVVRVDVSVTTKDDRPITDLTTADFEVAEDGVAQKVDTAQFVRLDGQRKAGDETSLEIRSREHALAEAARDDVRLFVIFLDDYHIDKIPSVTIPLREGLTTFISKFQPTDLIAIVDPLTPTNAVVFTRSLADLTAIVRQFEGRHNEIFPVKGAAEEAQLRSGDVERLRAEVTLSALEALSVHLGGVREGRKTVIFVSQGPPLMSGGLTLDTELRDVVEAANRANVTIDTVDPRGLGSYTRAADSMYSLAAGTGGRAILNTNAFEIGLRQVVEDASAYYLVGYSPTRTEDDGKYHKISVKVKRSGAHVLAREGYWAPSRKEMDAAAEISNRPQVPGVASAMKNMARLEPRGAVQAWFGLSRTPDGKTQATLTWEPATTAPSAPVERLELEIVPAGGRTPVGPQLVVSATPPGQRTRPRGSIVLPPGEVLLRFTARSDDGAAIDRWEQPFVIPDLSAPAVALATPRFYVAASLPEVRELQTAADPTPRATRVFRQTDRVFVDVECYAGDAASAPVITAQLLSADGKPLLPLPVPPLQAGKARLELPIRGLGKGTYLLRVRAEAGGARADHIMAFRVTP
jgi:VWFA-related protein